MKIVLDMDDVMWGMNEIVCARLGIDINKLHKYDVGTNTMLTESEKSILLREYSNPDTFKDIEWSDGVLEIPLLTSLGAEVYLNSKANSDGVVRQKHIELSKIDVIPRGNINIGIGASKVIGDDVEIFVDDCMEHHISNQVAYNILIDKPWNTPREEFIGIESHIIRCRDFKQVMAVCRDILNKG